MKCRKVIQFVILLVFVFDSHFIHSQNNSFFQPSPVENRTRMSGVAIAEGALFTGAILALNVLWYKGFHRQKFHFFKDGREWLQMDKAGHAISAYNLSVFGTDVYRWSGMNAQRSYIAGSATGFLFLSIIEIFDGFSSGWGFSNGDMIANLLGSSFSAGQYAGWGEQRIQLKFSYRRTIYPSYRPEILGKGFFQKVLKDYNGQTYWLSANISSFCPANLQIPTWLNLAIGMGAEGMISGMPEINIDSTSRPAFKRFRKFYISPDLNFQNLPVNDIVIQSALKSVNFLKCPLPALEFIPSKRKWKAKLFGF